MANVPLAVDKWQTATLGASYVPYSANVVWQDTTSNATYCSANAALTQAR